MLHELLKEITSNPQSARLLQEALASQQQLQAAAGGAAPSAASSATSNAMPSTSNFRSTATKTSVSGKASSRSDSAQVTQLQLQQDLLAWKQKAIDAHRRLLALQEQSFIAATRTHHDAAFLDWPDGEEASLVEDMDDDDGTATEHAASEVVDRFRSGSALDIPDSRRGRRLEQGVAPYRSTSHVVHGGIPAAVAVPSPGPLFLAAQPRSGAPSSTVKSRRTPRTPSLTQADRADRIHPSHSRSVVVGTSPVVGVPPLPPAVQRAEAHAAAYYPAAAMTARHQRAPLTVADRSPAPNPPQVHTTFVQGSRSAAQMRSGGLGGVEAESRGASSAASSVAGAIRPLRSGGGARSPSPQNPKRGSNAFRNLILSGVGSDERERVAAAISRLTNARLVASDTSDTLPSLVTHVVTPGANIRSFKALCALVSAKYVVNPQYVLESAKAGYWLEELDFSSSAYIPTRPLEHQSFLVVMDEPSLRDLVMRVIAYGGGQVLHTARKGVADDVVVIHGPQELLDYITNKAAS